MSLVALKRWHWMILSLMLGGVVAGVWQAIAAPDFNRMGPSFNDQPQFEKLITPDRGGTPAFRNLIVYPAQIDGQRFHAVVGTRQIRPGVEQAEVFIATTPYVPVALRGKTIASDSTVLAFLRNVPGISYQYAWWYDPRVSNPILMVASFVLVGLLWPTLINLLIFGTLRRQREEPAASLLGIPGSTRAVSDTMADAQALDESIAELQHNVGALDSAAPSADQSTATAPRPLSGETETAILISEEKPRAFGAKPDDFYPTERIAPHGPREGSAEH